MSGGRPQFVSSGIVLSRIEFGEADRIVTILTPDHGKLHLMAKGARRLKSKLAGGIELFSESDITFMPGRSDIGTLISARLHRHYSKIVDDIQRVQLGYELIALLHKNTEDAAEAGYYLLLQTAFQALDTPSVSQALIRNWFTAQLLRLGGHTPNLRTDPTGITLRPGESYSFDHDKTAFLTHAGGRYDQSHIKLLRLLFGGTNPQALAKIDGADKLMPAIEPLLTAMRSDYLRV